MGSEVQGPEFDFETAICTPCGISEIEFEKRGEPQCTGKKAETPVAGGQSLSHTGPDDRERRETSAPPVGHSRRGGRTRRATLLRCTTSVSPATTRTGTYVIWARPLTATGGAATADSVTPARRARYTCTASNRSQPRVELRRDGRLASREDCCNPWTNIPPGRCDEKRDAFRRRASLSPAGAAARRPQFAPTRTTILPSCVPASRTRCASWISLNSNTRVRLALYAPVAPRSTIA